MPSPLDDAAARLPAPDDFFGQPLDQEWREVGRFLGPSIEELYAREPDLSALWRAAGIREVHERRMSFGAGIVVWGIKDGHGAA